MGTLCAVHAIQLPLTEFHESHSQIADAITRADKKSGPASKHHTLLQKVALGKNFMPNPLPTTSMMECQPITESTISTVFFSCKYSTKAFQKHSFSFSKCLSNNVSCL